MKFKNSMKCKELNEGKRTFNENLKIQWNARMNGKTFNEFLKIQWNAKIDWNAKKVNEKQK